MGAKNKIDDDKPVTRREMINYIGPIFEELKEDNRKLSLRADKVDGRLDKIDGRLDSVDNRFHRLEVIMESDKREIIGALETFFAVSAKAEVVENHGHRISSLTSSK